MIVYAESDEAQGTLDWQRARLGKITGSKCGDLMVKGRAKDEIFGATAKDYLYELAGERSLNRTIVESDEMFSGWLSMTKDINSKAIRYGHENEADARRFFADYMEVDVKEVISCPHDTLPNFAASPDGIVVGWDGRPIAVVEIKSVFDKTFIKYRTEVKTAEDLKKVNSTYYWQMQAEMMCTNLPLTYFVVYCPSQKKPMYIAEIPRVEEDCALLAERIRLANEYIDNLTSDGQ